VRNKANSRIEALVRSRQRCRGRRRDRSYKQSQFAPDRPGKTLGQGRIVQNEPNLEVGLRKTKPILGGARWAGAWRRGTCGPILRNEANL